MIEKHAIEAAAQAIEPHLTETPAVRSSFSGEVFLKLENLQKTGSFKARGAMNKLLAIGPAARAAGVVTASSGNHGAAVAFGANQLGCHVDVFVPEAAVQSKIEAIRRLGGHVAVHGADCVQAEEHARAQANEHGKTYISPYNDPDVVAGQGTIAVELERQLGNIDAVFVSLGGGGLISGIGSYLKQVSSAQIVACSPAQSPAMHECLEAGAIIDVPCHETLSDGTAGGVELGAITFELCRQVVDRSIVVTEDEIRRAMLDFISTEHMLLEGAAGVALAAFARVADEYASKRVVIVICGANIGLDTLRKVLA